MRSCRRRACSSGLTSSQYLSRNHAGLDHRLLYLRHGPKELLHLFLGAKTHHPLDPGAVVPATIEDHDLAGGRKVANVALGVHLGLFALGRRRQRDHPEHARADPFRDRLDRRPCPRRRDPRTRCKSSRPCASPIAGPVRASRADAEFLLVLLTAKLGGALLAGACSSPALVVIFAGGFGCALLTFLAHRSPFSRQALSIAPLTLVALWRASIVRRDIMRCDVSAAHSRSGQRIVTVWYLARREQAPRSSSRVKWRPRPGRFDERRPRSPAAPRHLLAPAAARMSCMLSLCRRSKRRPAERPKKSHWQPPRQCTFGSSWPHS